jgi:hypothetical protein
MLERVSGGQSCCPLAPRPAACYALGGMKPRAVSNGLSQRTIRLLLKAGFTLDKDAIIRALQTAKLCPNCRPPNYGITTHRELCRWAGVDLAALPQGWPDYDRTPYPPNGLSYRANRCLRRAGIVATRESVIQALKSGALAPGQRPAAYGVVTHAELCRWTGFHPAVGSQEDGRPQIEPVNAPQARPFPQTQSAGQPGQPPGTCLQDHSGTVGISIPTPSRQPPRPAKPSPMSSSPQDRLPPPPGPPSIP